MIKNRTRKTILCKKTETASSFWKKAWGLMFRKSLGQGQGMLFIFSRESRPGFWTPFMRFPIDIIFLDSSKRVVDIRENLGPWRLCTPARPSKYALELKAGKAGQARTRVGDSLEFRAR
jgi:uncharacterized membrane protein (UPF0127 family)